MKYIIVDFVNAISGETVRSLSFSTTKYAEEYCSKYNENSHESMVAIVRTAAAEQMTPFQRVAAMNEAFGNTKGDAENIGWVRVKSQCANLFDEYCELLEGLGCNIACIHELKYEHTLLIDLVDFNNVPSVEAVRDALCDIQVFAQGAQYMMGYDGDNDMHDVVDGVMSRFIKDEADKVATVRLHAAKGVVEVYFEGEFPKMVMKSAVDQTDAPIHKFLKSNSYKNTKFRPAP